MIQIRKTGFRSKSLGADISLGLMDGLDSALWCYGFATVIFAGVLSPLMPVGVLAMLLGWALLSTFIALTSKAPIHMAGVDEQSVVILAAIGLLMSSSLGDAASSSSGLATMMTIIVICSLAVSVSCYLVGRYHLSRFLELLPFPVICGFMAGIGWLLLDAAVVVATDVPISLNFLEEIAEGNRLERLSLTLLGGIGLMWMVNRVEKAWSLPLASLLIVAGFYLAVFILGTSQDELISGGWLFQVTDSEGGPIRAITALTLSDINVGFIASVAPQILTLIFLTMLSASMSLTAFRAVESDGLNTSDEFQSLAGGNLLCAFVACPPGYTDPVASSLYKNFGASSRWMPLASSFVCLLVAIMGGWMITVVPKLLVGATVFLFAFQTLYDWMYENVGSFSSSDYAIVCIILGTIMFVGFMPGILVGIVLTVVLFVIRYSMISAVQARHSLSDRRSSVERSISSNLLLNRDGTDATVYTLRGFLFFGTANSILDMIRDDERIQDGDCRAVLMDMRRVMGLDISALNTFLQIKNACESAGVLLLYSGLSQDLQARIESLGAVSERNDEALIFSEADYAIEYLEDLLLAEKVEESAALSIRDYLAEMIDDEEKVQILYEAMTPVSCPAGETLFAQGDADTGLYVVEKGSLSAIVNSPAGDSIRIKKFNPGSLVGELPAYLSVPERTASVVANEDSVLYHLSPNGLARLDAQDYKLAAYLHELVARTLAERLSYLTRRLTVVID